MLYKELIFVKVLLPFWKRLLKELIFVEVVFHTSAHVEPIFPAQIVEEAVLSLWIDFGLFVKNWLAVAVWVHFWGFPFCYIDLTLSDQIALKLSETTICGTYCQKQQQLPLYLLCHILPGYLSEYHIIHVSFQQPSRIYAQIGKTETV